MQYIDIDIYVCIVYACASLPLCVCVWEKLCVFVDAIRSLESIEHHFTPFHITIFLFTLFPASSAKNPIKLNQEKWTLKICANAYDCVCICMWHSNEFNWFKMKSWIEISISYSVIICLPPLSPPPPPTSPTRVPLLHSL